MPALDVSKETRAPWEPPPVKPLDEAVWQAWLTKGQAQERRGSAAHLNAVKWISIATLLAAAGLWSHLGPYEIVVRFIAAAGAMIVMIHALRVRHYALAAGFGALALVYNPVVPVFDFSGGWQRAVVAATAVPFLASLTGAARGGRTL